MPELELWLNRNLANYERKYSILSERDKSLIVEWLNSGQRPSSIPRISVPQALEKARRWKLRQEYQRLTEEDFSALELVFKDQPNVHWVKLNSEQNYLREGSLMQHCVAEYFKSKKSYIFSLRDKHNLPLATLELDPETNQIFQIKGPRNGAIQKEYHCAVKSFVDYQINSFQALFPNAINSLLDLGNFEHLIYQQQVVSCESFKKLKKLRDKDIIVNQLTLDEFPAEVEADLLYLKNIKSLKSLNLKLKVKTLVIANCAELESLKIEGSIEQLIVDNCSKLKLMPDRLKCKKVIIHRCPKLKQVAKYLEAEECLIIKSFLQSIANECSVKKLVLFNVKLQNFADIFKVKRLLFSHLSPLNGNHFKLTVAPLVSQVEVISCLNYWDTVAFYCYQCNFSDDDYGLKIAQETSDKSIRDFERQNLSRLDELSIVFSYPLGFKDLYFKFIAYLEHKFIKSN